MTDGIRARVLVVAPSYTGDFCAHFVWSMMQSQMLCLAHGILLEFEWIQNQSLIDCARDQLLARFLERPEFSHVLFIDADLGWQPDAIHRMVERRLDVIGGVYPPKLDGATWPYVAKAGYLIDGVREVERLPGGFMLLTRRAVEALAANAPKYNIKVEGNITPVPRIFEVIIENGGLLSEDYRVSDKLRALGFQIFAECDLTFTHAGRYTWKGNLLQHMDEQEAKRAS